MFGQLLAQFRWIELSVRLGAEIGNQTRIAGDIFARGDHRFLHAGKLHEARLNLTQFNAEAAYLDLKIITAQIVDIPVWQPAGKIARLVHPGFW
ncbi:hypothetical protein PB72LOC_04456 [Pectobacterium atrosepticum]|nr:hypothetical protein PB72LOC_04456 [Pectobacterium atrosepticum]